MKNPFKKKSKFPTPSAPRTAEEIRALYNTLKQKAGDAQYLVYAYTRELENLNRQMLDVNQEYELRRKLDAEVAAQVKKEEDNVQP